MTEPVDILIEAAYLNSLKHWEENHVRWEEAGYTFNKPTYSDFQTGHRVDWSELTDALCAKNGFPFDLEGETYTVIEVDSYGGEGHGDEYWHLYQINDRYFKLEATWVSWDGVYWDEAELYEVEPKEVTVTKWVKK